MVEYETLSIKKEVKKRFITNKPYKKTSSEFLNELLELWDIEVRSEDG